MPSRGSVVGDHGRQHLRLATGRYEAPSAWRAILPVSRTSLRPPESSSTRWISNIAIVSHGFREGAKAMSKTARG